MLCNKDKTLTCTGYFPITPQTMWYFIPCLKASEKQKQSANMQGSEELQGKAVACHGMKTLLIKLKTVKLCVFGQEEYSLIAQG